MNDPDARSENPDPYLAEVTRPIVREMFERLMVDLDERDRWAVGTAVSKAASAGYYQGLAAAAAVAHEHGVSIMPTFEAVHTDPWAERYGDQELEDE